MGHWAAGRWLATHARPDELILDTRGWARFVSGRPGYDYWHVRQALTDSHLSYILVGLDELNASSRRAATLKSVLAYSATPLVDFPASPDDPKPGRATLPLPTPGNLGRTGPVNDRTLWQRWIRGVSWTWVNERYRGRLPEGFEATIMSLRTDDRLHAKQGRSTARVVFHPARREPRRRRIRSRSISSGTIGSPGRPGWRRPSIPRGRTPRRPPSGPTSSVPGRWESRFPTSSRPASGSARMAGLSSFLMVAELTDCEALHEVLPKLADRLDPSEFAGPEASGDRGDGPDHGDLARRSTVPQGPVPVPLLPRCRLARAGGRDPSGSS